MEYFKKLLDLLKLEREEDRNLYHELIEKSSVSDRRASGVSWYPVAIRSTEMSRGDYLTVELERTTHQDISHQLRFGASAALFSNHDPNQDRQEGVIAHQAGDRLKLTLRTDELPDWARDGKLGVDLLFDEYSYDEMQNALRAAATVSEKSKEGKLTRLLTGDENLRLLDEPIPYSDDSLNQSQQKAVSQILSADYLAIVHGPPGTGKTTTLVEAVRAIVKSSESKLLVVAPSNTAVDLLSEKMTEQGINVIRIGNPTRVSERLVSSTLDAKIASHSSMKELKKMKKQAAEFRNMAHKYKRNFGRAEREQRKALFDEARAIMRHVEQTEQYIVDDLLSRAQVITATLVGANHYTIKNLKFHTVVIDEAGQAIEPACWIPILKAEKLILAGDPYQLPPTIKSNEASVKGLSTTLLEKLISRYPGAVSLLAVQYRMNEMIMGFSSEIFYENKLKADDSVANHVLIPGDQPLNFIDTAGCGFEEKQVGTSTSNPEEATFLISHLDNLVGGLNDHFGKDDFPSIAIISPYKEQVNILNDLVTGSTKLLERRERIVVNTIDSFQGQERDIVYISLTRSNADSKVGFLAEIRRMNVAMTRARKKLVVIGDSSTLSQVPFYAAFIKYAEEKNSYHSAWEFINS